MGIFQLKLNSIFGRNAEKICKHRLVFVDLRAGKVKLMRSIRVLIYASQWTDL